MRHTILYGISSLLFALGFVIWSINQATAYPNGTSVNLGSNPIVTFRCLGNGSVAYTVPANQDLIITDYQAGDNVNVFVDGSIFVTFYHYAQRSSITGWEVPANSNVTCSGTTAYLSGYLVHP